ncbi:hypothetical protein FHR71_005353 [Methylobacterium sp. RAS18]|nr:hypothetical protein [Methylobacterium sp. RAS18]
MRWIGAGLILLLAVTGFGAWREAQRYTAQAAQITTAERERWLGQDAKNPHSADHFGLWLFRPSAPLAVLDPGTEPYTGRMVRVEAHVFNDAVYRAEQDAGPLARTGLGSIAYIVQLVVPLAAILLGFSTFAADRERGTLRLALGNGAPPGRLFAARLAALLLVLILVVGCPLLAIGSLVTIGQDGAGWQVPARLPVWVAVQIAYASVFLLLAMLVSLVAPTARAALSAALVAWVLVCVAAPRLATAGVDAFVPTLSYREVRARIDAGFREHICWL